jgi:hypothetical protein
MLIPINDVIQVTQIRINCGINQASKFPLFQARTSSRK